MRSKKSRDSIGRRCPYCSYPMMKKGKRQATRDHVIPKSTGGDIIVICCLECNSKKADMHPDFWLHYLYDKGIEHFVATVVAWRKAGYYGKYTTNYEAIRIARMALNHPYDEMFFHEDWITDDAWTSFDLQSPRSPPLQGTSGPARLAVPDRYSS